MRTFIVAGTETGVGKTTIAAGLMAALARRGHAVQGFKVGPDYLDPSYHRAATGRPGRNLDLWMCGRSAVRRSYARSALDVNVVDSGCCGMAGSFGYEADHYDVGLACGERALLPAVRATSDDNLLIADGFSCREMIRQETGREPLHTAQVLAMAVDRKPARSYRPRRPTGAVAAGVAAAAVAWWCVREWRSRA